MPRRSGDGVAYSVRNEDMQQFRAANPVENRLARLANPAFENRRRQSLPRRNRKTQRRQIGALVHRGHHRPIGGRRGKANRGLVGLNDIDHLAGCRVFQQRRGGAEPQRKDRKTAESEGKGKRR